MVCLTSVGQSRKQFVYLYCISILFISTPACGGQIKDIITFIKLSKHIVDYIKCMESDNLYTGIETIITGSCDENRLLESMKNINGNIESLKIQLNGLKTLQTMIKQIPEMLHDEIKLNELWNNMEIINNMYIKMKKYINNIDKFNKNTLVEFAQSAISHQSGSVNSLLGNIQDALMGNANLDGKGILELQMHKKLEIDKNICLTNTSQQRLILNLYYIIGLAQIKGYSIIQFSYSFLELYKKENFTTEAAFAKKEYEDNQREGLNMLIKIASNASREIWMCDPEKHQAGVTYLEITELLQGIIHNEENLNMDMICSGTCDDFSHTKYYGSCTDSVFCKQRKCHGTILNCVSMESNAIICPTRKGGNRRYDYIQYEYGKTLGEKGKCSNTVKLESWNWNVLWKCAYCACLCDESGLNSDRFINMLPSLSNIKQNMVVTGIKFTKQNRIIHLQIQEGKLLPHESIDQDSLKWVPVEDYNTTDSRFKNGLDFQMLTWKERSLDLHDIHKSPWRNEVVTGVKFRKVGYHLNLEVRFTAYNKATGKLFRNKSEWRVNYNTEASKNPRQLLDLENLDVPTKSKEPSLPDSNSNQFIVFTNSDWDKDAAQTTVPFLDAQAVTATHAVPLSGIGLYHKGQPGFGGFVAPRIFSLDVTNNLRRILNEELRN